MSSIRDQAGTFASVMGRNGAGVEANVDGSLATYAAPGKALLFVGGSALPVTSAIGETYFLQTGPNAGLYQCVSINTWVQLISLAGVPNASQTVKGIAEISWPATAPATPIATASTDPRVNVLINATFAGVPSNGVTDAYPALQALINAQSSSDRTGKFGILLDNVRYQLSHPLRIPQTCELYGQAQTIFVPNYGAGYCLVVGTEQGNLTLGAPVWYSNSVNAMVSSKIGDKPYVNCSVEPNMFLRGLTAFTFDTVFQRTGAASEGGVIISSTAFLGSVDLTFVAYEIAENINAGISVTWRNELHNTANGILDLAAHHLALVFNDPTVTLYLDGVNILTFNSAGPISQQYCETVCIAHEARNMQETIWRYSGIDGRIGPCRWSSVARWNANFVPPTLKPVVDANTLLIVDPDVRDGDYVVGSVGVKLFLGSLFPIAPRSSYLLVAGTPEVLIGNVIVKNIIVEGGASGNYVASGFYFFNTIKSVSYKCYARQTMIGCIWAGVTFNADQDVCEFNTQSYAWACYTQSESSSFRNIGANGGALTVSWIGSVGGPNSTFLVTPGSTTSASVYIEATSDVALYGLQIDDEGQDTSALIAGVIINNCRPKIYEGILAVTRAIDVISCAGGGAPMLYGVTMVTASITPELVHFESQPDQPGIIDSVTLGIAFPASTVMSFNPEWLCQRQDFQSKTKYVDALTEYRFQDHTCLRIQQEDVTSPVGGVVIDVQARAAIEAMLLQNRRSRWYKLDDVASQDESGVATAQTFLVQPGRSFFPSYANQGTLTGADQHFWNSSVLGVFPQWLEMAFTAEARVYEIDIVSVQDNYLNPVEPTDDMVFTLYGIVDFDIQSFDGVSWNTIESVVGNNLVIRRVFLSSAFVGTELRINVITAADGNYARCVAFQCWGVFT